MLSLSSPNAGSRALRGWSWGPAAVALPDPLAVGVVVWPARRDVREGGRSGVVGREGMLVAVPVRDVERGRVVVEKVSGVGVVAAISVGVMSMVPLSDGTLVECCAVRGTA